MVTIYDIAPKEVWDAAFAEKLINRQVHPTLPLEIYDYSQIAQFSRSWNAATLAARGLIVDAETKEIVGRPLGKFFNYGEPGTPEEAMTGPIVVSDKADGSMAVSYPTPSGSLNISTRGSFMSDQAQHATAVYLERYDGAWTPAAGYTYVWEIIYPSNRIVVNYGDLDDLILIARVNIETGVSEPASAATEWLWRKVEEFPYTSLPEALAAAPRENVEGLVVHFLSSDARVKVKQDDYVTLHRVITGASSRRIHEMLVSGADFTSWIIGLPDEFVTYVETTKNALLAEFASVRAVLEEEYGKILAQLPEGYTQKDFALIVSRDYPSSMKGLLFSRHRGESGEEAITKSIWKQIEPEFEKPFWNLNGKTVD